MWVIVRERTHEGYLGMLDNAPASLVENATFWVGAELPFAARHIIDIRLGNEVSAAAASKPPPIPWRDSCYSE